MHEQFVFLEPLLSVSWHRWSGRESAAGTAAFFPTHAGKLSHVFAFKSSRLMLCQMRALDPLPVLSARCSDHKTRHLGCFGSLGWFLFQSLLLGMLAFQISLSQQPTGALCIVPVAGATLITASRALAASAFRGPSGP